MDRGQMWSPIEVDQHGLPIDRDSPLKKKRSLKRLFSLSRQNDTKSPTSPVSTSEIPPTMPQAITSNEPATPVNDVWSHKRSVSISRDEDLAQNIQANGEPQGQEPRSSTSTTRSTKITNFSRPSRDRRHTLSVDEPRSSSPRTPAFQQTQPGMRTSQGSRPSVTLSYRPSNERLSNSPLQVKSSPPRPFTSGTDTRPGISLDIPKVPFAPKGKPTIGDTGANEEVRASMRSGTSTWSSGFDSGSTKHSSVFTKISSLRDSTTTTDMSDTDHPKRSMTVEDTVDLYSREFQDEPPDLKLKQIGMSGSELEQRTAKIAQAMNEPLTRFGSSTTIQGRNASAVKATPEFEAPGPPALCQPTETHDQYGFRKASREVTVKEWNSWWKDYSKTQARRTTRWISLMKSHGLAMKNPMDFPQRSPKVQRYVRKGVPPAWRGNLWYYYAGGQAYANRFPGLYQELVAGTVERLNASDKEAIDRDIHRTFPDNLHFKPEQPLADGSEPPLLCSLRRLLYAFAIHHPRIGYCQSLNFLAGLLLLFLPEEKAFWLLHIVTSRYLPGTHEVSLEGANIDLWVLMLALKDENPTMWNKIGGETSGSGARLPPVSLVTTPWFMSLFIGTLPIESVLRVWDLLFYDGSPSIFRAALAIFRLGESEISRVNDPMEIFQVVQAIPRKMLDATTLAMVANRKGAVNGSWIEIKRRERRNWYAEERAAEKSRRKSGEAQAPAAHTDSEDIKAQTAARDHAPPMGRHLSAARSAGDLSRTKSKGLFTRRSGPRAEPEEPLPALRRPADPKLPVRGSSLTANVHGTGVDGNAANGGGINGKPDTPTPKFGTPKARPGTPREREGSVVVEGV